MTPTDFITISDIAVYLRVSEHHLGERQDEDTLTQTGGKG